MRRRLAATLGALALLLAAVVFALASPASRPGADAARVEAGSAREEAEEAVEGLRKASGHTSEANPARPVVSAPPRDGRSEQVWSASANDWEPAIAADPVSSWVYQATTRYGGPKACTQCPDPAIIVRASSDGGVTWGPDRYICACKNTKAQNDPQLAVATNGTIYAAWLNDYNPGVVFSKSTDHGVTWTPRSPSRAKASQFSDKPILAISPERAGRLHRVQRQRQLHGRLAQLRCLLRRPRQDEQRRPVLVRRGRGRGAQRERYFAESAENQSATGQVEMAVVRSTNGGAAGPRRSSTRASSSPPAPCRAAADFFASQAADRRGLGRQADGCLHR